MYMSKLSIDPAVLVRTGVYEAHQALWQVFSDSPDRERDFLYRQTDRFDFLTVSARKPLDTPLLRRVSVKDYSPKLAVGDRLAFSLRFNPVVKRRNERNRQERIDMVQDERKRLEREGVPRQDWPSRLELAEQVALSWLTKREPDLGLRVDQSSLMVEAYDQDRFRKAGGKRVTLSRLDVRGIAEVMEPQALAETLFRGVGCAKGFGFGLLLVRKA